MNDNNQSRLIHSHHSDIAACGPQVMLYQVAYNACHPHGAQEHVFGLEGQTSLLLGASFPCLVWASSVSCKASDAMQALLLVLGKHRPGADSSFCSLPSSGNLP